MAGLVAEFEFEDVSKINSKESSSKLEEYFIETLEKGAEVINIKKLFGFLVWEFNLIIYYRPLVEFVICCFSLFLTTSQCLHDQPFVDLWRRSRY